MATAAKAAGMYGREGMWAQLGPRGYGAMKMAQLKAFSPTCVGLAQDFPPTKLVVGRKHPTAGLSPVTVDPTRSGDVPCRGVIVRRIVYIRNEPKNYDNSL